MRVFRPAGRDGMKKAPFRMLIHLLLANDWSNWFLVPRLAGLIEKIFLPGVDLGKKAAADNAIRRFLIRTQPSGVNIVLSVNKKRVFQYPDHFLSPP
jgi:uncharacterized protein YqcC (DUF446 family)